ncbi:MAG: RNA 3'-terminal phosphate cyclase [Chloroflexi bacterium]|nr:RNA 3'-terminal phosphate cyclase [Chloroflexota bacterium]
MSDLVTLDGSYGEGGGQIVRTALALSALSGVPVRIENVRAGREEPGLRPQHLAGVRAMATICRANVRGNELGARTLLFEPTIAPQAGEYRFDVARLGAEGGGGSAGSVTLLFQMLFLPLALAEGDSQLTLLGGTHVRWSPPYQYITEVYMPTVERIGFMARLELGRWGFYPRGGGEMMAHITSVGPEPEGLQPLVLMEKGRLEEVWGISAAAHLPEHVIQRQREQAIRRLRARHIKAEIEAINAPSIGPGTVLFLLAQYEELNAGFTGYGRVRYPAEKVADDAVDAFEEHLTGQQAVDPHLADQLVLPLALVPGTSSYTTTLITRHLITVAWVVEQMLERQVTIEGAEGHPGTVHIA